MGREWDTERERQRKQEYRERRRRVTEEVPVVEPVAVGDDDKDVVAEALYRSRLPSPERLEEMVKQARANAFPESKPDFGSDVVVAPDERTNADRAEAYCRWRVEAYARGEVASPY